MLLFLLILIFSIIILFILNAIIINLVDYDKEIQKLENKLQNELDVLHYILAYIKRFWIIKVP